ncbi:MAG: SLBB domain-containing protein, partial [Planktomarina sp.]|nr:SLBB domain-containing protein [Planktomarina sp.]
ALSDANVAEVFLDGKAFAFLPSEQPQTLTKMLKILGGLPVSLSKDLILLSFSDANKKPRATTILRGALTILQGGVKVNIFTKNGLRTIIKEIGTGRDDTIALDIKSRANTLFIDGQMVAAFGEFNDLGKTSFLDFVRMDTTIYPIFLAVSKYNDELGNWDKEVFTLTQLLNEKFDTKNGARIDLLSTPFLQSLLKNMNSVEMRVEFGNKDTAAANQLKIEEQQNLSPLDFKNTQVMAPERDIDSELKEKLPPLISIETLEFASRFVGGGVKHPGSYPMAETVTLAEIIATAGGVTPNADTRNIIVQDYQVQGGRLVTSEPRRFSISEDNFDKVILSGQFSVDIQTFVNDAFSGSIVLSGEMNRPGEYIFSRSETLHDVLARAEGLSDAAYPLGAVLERRSAKVQEKAGNVILAEQVQQAVLQLSTSETEGAGDQISAVLGFADQLKEQKPSGRLSVNVLLRDSYVPIFLEDGDRLIIPKRPAHVSIIGSVSQSVKATYGPQKKVSDYIAAAGGYSRTADKRRTYMLLPNGEATPLTADTIIPPGSVLIVPPKTDRLSILGLTDLVSRVLGNIATSILAINNVN